MTTLAPSFLNGSSSFVGNKDFHKSLDEFDFPPHPSTSYRKIITDSRIRSIICKGPKYRFPVQIDFKSCREEIAGALQEFCNRWCKREHVESNALNSWKLNISKIIDGRISFYCNNLDLLPPKPKFTFRHLKKGIQEFHRKFVLAPADKAANNVVVV